MQADFTETVDPADSEPAIGVLERGTVIASRYEIEDLIGSGGFSRVYAARDRELGERVAIKILRSDRVTPATLSRLRREVKLTREISRATLVRVFDLGQDRENTFLTMELVPGETLRDRIARGPLPVDEVIAIAKQMLDALGGLHAAGVVHRDVKPANILLTPDGGAKLADFGLARLWESGDKVTRTEAFVGTLEYVAPEQAIGGQLDGRTDLYSFGVLLFEMLAGKVPHEGTTNIGKVVAHLTSRAPDVRTEAPDVPAWLAELIRRLMERDPADRPPTAEAVLEAMQTRKRDVRWRLKRSRAGLAIGALATAAAVVSGAWAWNAWWGSLDRVERNGTAGLRAVDKRGRTLWSDPELTPGRSATIVQLDRTDRIVAALPFAERSRPTLEDLHRLQLLEASTGAVTRELVISGAANAFPLEPTFRIDEVTAIDPDHDGRDDVLVTYTHTPYWASYSVYVDPRSAESGPILIASGHHRLAGMTDLDGDGTDELFFIGPNNRMGRFTAIAAVKVIESREGPDPSAKWAQASTPDAEYARETDALAWYALQPRLPAYACSLASADPVRRELRFDCRGGREFVLDYDGFEPGARSALDPSERREARATAYRELRDALRKGAAGEFDDALRQLRAARDRASAVVDHELVEWADTSEATLLARSGRFDEADALFTRLVGTSDSTWQVSLLAGRAFESQGEVHRAERFLRNALGGATQSVWDKPELTGLARELVLVLAQQERWADAREVVVEFAEAYPEDASIATYLGAFVGWRSGSPTISGMVLNPSHPGMYNYWYFEGRWALGVEDPSAFLAEMNAFRPDQPDPDYLYRSLEAEILSRLGRKDEARAMAARALAATREAAKDDMLARAHIRVVEERANRFR